MPAIGGNGAVTGVNCHSLKTEIARLGQDGLNEQATQAATALVWQHIHALHIA